MPNKKNITSTLPVSIRPKKVGRKAASKVEAHIPPEVTSLARAYAKQHNLIGPSKQPKKRNESVALFVTFKHDSGVHEVKPFIAALRKQGHGVLTHFLRTAIRDAVTKTATVKQA